MKVLIVKVSSLGDVIHTLPAVTDAVNAKTGLSFDWVVEEAFAEIPAWHPAVDKVIPVALRRWRKNPLQTWRSGEFAMFKKNLQERHYDLVIDAQGLIKSGLISRISKGLTVGLSNSTIKEPFATLFYNVRYTVPWQQHAVDRVRDLFSRTFNYSIDARPLDYGLSPNQFVNTRADREKFIVFLHGTTWESKLWPENNWLNLARIAGDNGYKVKMFWGNQEELDRARWIANGADNVDIMDKLDLTGIAREMVGSDMVISVDTGLAHLGAALNLPVLSIYGSTDPELTGTLGNHVSNIQSSLECSPCLKKKCPLLQSKENHQDGNQYPPCYEELSAEYIWQKVTAGMVRL